MKLMKYKGFIYSLIKTLLLIVIFLVIITMYYKNKDQSTEYDFQAYKSFLETNNRNCSQNTSILIVIRSLIENTEYRLAIRNSWASQSLIKHKITTIFVLDDNKIDSEDYNKTIKESLLYGDIVFDQYQTNNLSDYIMPGYKWFRKHCNFSYVLLIDDTSFIDFKQLLETLEKYQHYKLLHLINDEIVDENSQKVSLSSLDAQSLANFNKNMYTSCFSKGNHLFSAEVFKRIDDIYIESFFQWDSVYLDIFIVQIHLVPIQNFQTSIISCNYVTGYVVHSNCIANCMLQVYIDYKKLQKYDEYLNYELIAFIS